MKQIFFSALLLMLATFSAAAQTTEGDWYTPMRNKLARVTIYADSIVCGEFSFDTTAQGYKYPSEIFIIKKKIGSTYIVSNAADTVISYHLFGFTTDGMHADKLYMNIESINTNFSTCSDAEKAIPEFEKQHFKIMLFTRQGIENMRKGKEIETMTTSDFNRYASKIIAADSANATYLNKRYKLSYLYSESYSKIFLAEIGVNPLVKGNRFDDMLEKFHNNPETNKVFMQMASPPKK